ncbi:hypothetical protein [Kribbella sp. NPDC006257]|uniref:hypothetical protein n=1 Tax=Kribbella sp. NPDC006257 TaxID=3156738 RepID=UPI0033ACEF63
MAGAFEVAARAGGGERWRVRRADVAGAAWAEKVADTEMRAEARDEEVRARGGAPVVGAGGAGVG